MVVVDSTIWIDFFRGRNEPGRAALRQLIRAQQAVLSGMALAEVLQGIRSPQEASLVQSQFASTPYLETTKETWIRVGSLSAELRRKGLTIPLTDLVIAVLAMEHDAEVFTTDPHFDKIPGLKLYRPK
jgi:predicted nucleic acid-binding protein